MRFRNVNIVGQGEILIDFELDSGAFKGVGLIDFTWVFLELRLNVLIDIRVCKHVNRKISNKFQIVLVQASKTS